MHAGARLTRLVCAALVAGAVLTAPSQAAAAATPVRSPERYILVVREGVGLDGKVLAEVDLSCNPVGGSHPRPAAACRALDEVDGRLDNLQPRHEALCIKIYQPVTVVAAGQWRGRVMYFQRSYGNQCELRSELAPVVDF